MKKTTDIAYVNANVISIDQPGILNGYDVVVKDGKITELVPTKGMGAYTGTRVLDCTGKYLMPSLWDMHVHVFNDEFLDYSLAWGITSVFNMWGFEKHLKWRREIESGKRIAPDLYTTGPIIDSLPTYPLITLATTPHEARNAVLETKNSGYDFVKIYNNLTPEVYAEIEKTAAEVGLEVIGHLPNCANSDYTGENQDYAIRQKTIEHILFINDDNIDKAVHQGVWLNPTFMVERTYRDGLDAAAQAAADELRPMIINTYWKLLGGQHKKPRKGAQKTVRKELAYYDRMFRDYLEKGGKVLLGTDSGFPNVIPGYAMHQELAAAVEHGMPVADALRCATLDAAQFLGKDGVSGSVTVGKNAELLVLNANPLDDIGNTAAIYALQKRDLFFDRDGLDRIKRRAKHRFPLAVESVFHSYLWTMIGQSIKSVFTPKSKKEAPDDAAS